MTITSLALLVSNELSEVLRLQTETKFWRSSLQKHYYAQAIGAGCRRHWYLAAASLDLMWEAWDRPQNFNGRLLLRKFETDALTVSDFSQAVTFCKEGVRHQVD
jgi:hypothetical protein